MGINNIYILSDSLLRMFVGEVFKVLNSSRFIRFIALHGTKRPVTKNVFNTLYLQKTSLFLACLFVFFF